MAVLNKIRQRSVFLIAIIALALFAFVLADVFQNGGFSTQKSQRIIGSVNGEDIDQQEFASRVEAQTARYGGNITNTQAVNAAWEEELRRILLDEQYEELGISIEQDRINDLLKEALQNDPNFQTDGVYSEQKVREYIATLRSTNPTMYDQWVAYEKQLAKNEQQQIYFDLVKAGINTSFKEGKMAYDMENNLRNIEFVQVPYTSIADDEVSVTKDDIEAYLKEHKDAYQTEASRNLRYVLFSEDATLTDEDTIKSSVAKLLNDRLAYTAATKTNDTVRGLNRTANVEDFVNENSDIRYNDNFLFKGELPVEVSDELWALNEGDVYGPYKDNGFYKISKVVAVTQIPDSVQSSHILLTYQGLQNAGAQTRTKAEAKELADSLATVIKASPSKMAELAPEYSADGSKEKGGDLGYVTKGRFVKPFNDFVFNGSTGDVGVVESQYGYHVIKIDDQKNRQRAIKLATVAKEITPSQQTINDVFNKTTKFQMAVSEDKNGFDEIAKENNYTVRPVNNVKALDETIPGQGSQREIIRWAFDEDRKTGDVNRFNVDGGYLVVQVTKKTEKGLMSVDEASPRVTPILRNEKKAAMIREKISGNDLNAIASANGVSVQTSTGVNLKNPTLAGAGTEPKVVGVAFGLEKGEVSKPIDGNKGVYVVKVTEITPARELDNYASFAIQKQNADRATANGRVYQALKDAADIEDKRANVY
ncbi:MULTISPECIES: peptidylprolyl isomerase [unclassified Leeuwenhoekiella]|uniref:peptidylprolyl isomerase n=1 Tax=unclassified Leeuwenhoekiella TaxID=2615029 RepID=UPI000C501AB3|nr:MULTISPECIES: peptidylprolyl isomerase [unclassified Leeuwenhoekiella]MAW97169.1 peptidylprolyl isomerase [Leeuwenhoekiella sp.]MBA82745.1 peptidylprolyl isomerase [Leeuwenhoekiella sp.]|tara:strand:- start:59715 stop:61835 length:2121 start_codon:yes stop_codon:yes gene_type:complete